MADDNKKSPVSKKQAVTPDPEIEALNEVEREELIDAIKENEPAKISTRFAAQHQLEKEKRNKIIVTILAVLLALALVGVAVLAFMLSGAQSDLKTKNDEISTLQSSKSSGTTKLEKEVKALKEDKKSLQEQLDETGKSTTELEDDLTKAQEENDALTDEITDLKVQMRTLERELAEARTQQSSGTRAGGATGSGTNPSN